MQRLLGVLAERLCELDLRLMLAVMVIPTYRVHPDLLQSGVRRCSNNLHNLNKLIVVVTATEERVPGYHLGEARVSSVHHAYSHTSYAPDIDGGGVCSGSKKNVRCAIP